MCGLPVAIHEFVVYRGPTGCLTVFYFSPFEVRDDSNPLGDGLSHLNRIKLGGAATTCNRVKTTNPEYKDTQQDLTGWKLSFPTLKGMQAFKEMLVINCRCLSNSTKEGGVLSKR